MKTDPSQIAWHTLSGRETLERLGGSDQGLDPEEARKRLERFGANSLGEEAELSRLKILFDQVKNPLIYILFAAAGVTAVLGHFKDSAVILAVIVINSAIGFWQEFRAEQSMRSLRRLVKAMAWVVRGGRGRGVVTATGLATLMGQIAEDVRSVRLAKTPLQERFERFAKRLGLALSVLFVVELDKLTMRGRGRLRPPDLGKKTSQSSRV